jgi:hypothetical protein
MPIGTARLSLLPFPQLWDGGSLPIRFLCLPKGDPQAPLKPGLAAFAAANLVFEAHLIGSLDRLPFTGDATPVGPLVIDQPPDRKADLFDELTRQFNITAPPGPPRPQPQFRKVITESYRAIIGDRRRSTYLAGSAEFECALHEGALDQPPDPVVLPDNVTWGQVIAYALRQPNLASALGLIWQTTVTPPVPGFFAAGGWLYIDLHATSDYAAVPGIAARYAARIPPLTADPRPVFAPLLFPVADLPGNFIADDVFREAERYEDGLAKLVHCAQTPGRGDGIQLAWEDEQIAEWLNRQVQRDPGGELLIDAPTGVSGYRVDVRRAGDAGWNSLVAVESVADLQLGAFSLGAFRGEAIVEVTPAQISPKQNGMFWFPSYFATWRGASLALTDPDVVRLHARPDVQDADTPPHLLQREKNFVPVDDKAVPLSYGNTYEFRVRMADLTRGGPGAGLLSPEPPRNSISSLTFQRRKAPGPVEILERPSDVLRQVRIAKPRLGYPEILFTGAAAFADLELDLDALSADRTITREISLPDPDVLTVEIHVQAKALDGDAAVYLPLYQTSRQWAADEMTIAFDIQDHPTLATLAVNQPVDGPVVLPAARDLRLTFIGIGRDDPGYFADREARHGAPVNLDVRAGAIAESQLLAEPQAFSALRAFFFQPSPPDGSVASPIERLAAEMDLDRAGLSLSGRAGSRTVLACSAELRHTLSPEASALTFASAADLVQRWIHVVQFTLQRDWTWDGLDEAGIAVTRVVHLPEGDTVEVVGTITLPRALAPQSRAGVPADARTPIRQSTELIFFDALDPKPKPPRKFPSEIGVDYVLQPAFKGVPPPDPVSASILLPVTTTPSQVPRILSAGIALSEYQKTADYSSTEPRQRMLWFEFAEPPADPEDAYYVRVRALGPDPMLLSRDIPPPDAVGAHPILSPHDVLPPDVIETPLPLDPEWMRLITPGQPRDENGLNAMQPLAESPSAPHYLIPLPANLKESSPELFGFFVYEVRIGHTAARWCTAQGRFGPMLRIAGVQHPAPPLVCQAARGKAAILVRAPFATPVIDGANVRPRVPVTEMWALLYARVPQLDREAWRNVLLTRTRLFPPHAGNDPQDEGARILYGEGLIAINEVVNGLRRLGLAADTPLTVLAAEMFADPPEVDPLGDRLGHARMLRVSPLAAVPEAC